MASSQTFVVSRNRFVAEDTFWLELAGDTSGITRAGQFVNVEVPGYFLRRPFSVCDWKDGKLDLLYKILGSGTKALSQVEPGTKLEVLSGLGNGFDLGVHSEEPLLVGGGIGVAPMLALARQLVDQGKKPRVVLGFGSAAEVALRDEIEALGVPVTISTVDGSAGVKGFVTDAMANLQERGHDWDYLFACGPTPMLRAVFEQSETPGQYSLEERMACGFGACMGCVVETTGGLQRICKEGPVFESGQLPW